MPNYENAYIYGLVNRNGDMYVGSSCNERRVRKSQHKSGWRNGTSTCMSRIVFENDPDGVDMVLLEKYPCKNKFELHTRERYWIERLDCVNKVIPGRTDKEYYKQYREQNKDKIKEYDKQYREQNKDKIKEYYEQNKEKLLQKHSCECGGRYTYGHKLRHLKTKKHQSYLAFLQNASDNLQNASDNLQNASDNLQNASDILQNPSKTLEN